MATAAQDAERDEQGEGRSPAGEDRRSGEEEGGGDEEPLAAETVAQTAREEGSDEAADQGATHRPSPDGLAREPEERLEERLGSADDDPIVAEEEPAHGRHGRDEPDVAEIEPGAGFRRGDFHVEGSLYYFRPACMIKSPLQEVRPMLHPVRSIALILTAGLSLISFPPAGGSAPGPDYAVKAVPMTAVTLAGGFWGDRQAVDIKVTIAHEMKECEATGRIRNFELAAAALKGATGGKLQSAYAFDDSDVYKVIEAAAYVLMLKPDPELERKIDVWIEKIAAAQEPDGYLYTARTINPKAPPRMSGPERWLNLADSHELYCPGHMYEAAVAYLQATGKKSLFNVAIKNAELILKTFGPAPGQLKLPPGHEEIEIGLVKLYRTTGERKYLDLAKFFIDQRGNAAGHKLYGTYAQDHKPVVEQDEAVGHAVRAAYLYSGMVDVAALTGETRYIAALDKIWTDVVTKKLYLTGGIGAAGGIEGFGPAYDLPNPSGYAETCATIALALWNWRMALYHADGTYMDLFERAAYNAFLSGAGMSGDLFFYPNPLASHGQHERTPWFTCACCPPNVARFIAQFGGFMYGVADGKVFVNLYNQGDAEVETPAGKVLFVQTTQYPWLGDVRIAVSPENAGPLTLMVRIPGWALGRPIPGRSLPLCRRDEGKADGEGERAGRPARDREGVCSDRPRMEAGRRRRDPSPDARPAGPGQREGQGRHRADRRRARPARLLHGMAGQRGAAELARPGRRRAAQGRAARRPPERDRHDHRRSDRLSGKSGKDREREAAPHPDPLLFLGPPRPGRDGSLAGPVHGQGPRHARADDRLAGQGDVFAGRKGCRGGS